MKLVNSSFEIIPQIPTHTGIFKHIEKCARIAYKSENRITEDSYDKFCQMLIDRGHWACLEQSTVYLTYDNTNREYGESIFMNNPYSRICTNGDFTYVSTNYRVCRENNVNIHNLCVPTTMHVPRITVKFICSRSIANELVRHRVFSFIQESQRYCLYSSKKFNRECTFIIPQWVYDIQIEESKYVDSLTGESKKYLLYLQPESVINELLCLDRSVSTWYNNLLRCEQDYIFLTTTDESYKLKPEEARSILPNDCKTEICMTGFIDQWQEFFKLRCAKDAHPDMQRLAIPLRDEFIKQGYIK